MARAGMHPLDSQEPTAVRTVLKVFSREEISALRGEGPTLTDPTVFKRKWIAKEAVRLAEEDGKRPWKNGYPGAMSSLRAFLQGRTWDAQDQGAVYLGKAIDLWVSKESSSEKARTPLGVMQSEFAKFPSNGTSAELAEEESILSVLKEIRNCLQDLKKVWA